MMRIVFLENDPADLSGGQKHLICGPYRAVSFIEDKM
jgi:hypothetical protein